MEEKDIKTIKTTKGELRYCRDWNNWDGGIRMLNAQTITRYKQIINEHPNADDYGVFFAFSGQQLAKGVQHIKELGFIRDESELVQDRETGAFGTDAGLTAFFKFYNDSRSAIPKECDPQEVYFYEYNNFESMYAWDGDLEAIKVIINYWGTDVARDIKRYNASRSINDIIKSK